MRHSALADALFPRARQQVLATLLQDPGRAWYLSDLARHNGTSPSSLQRELASLVDVGVILRSQDGNRTYYRASTHCPILTELKSLFAKTCGLFGLIEETLLGFGSQIQFAFVHGSVAGGEERSESDVDVLVVGSADLTALATAIKPLEAQLQREVNVSLYPMSEFRRNLLEGNHFLNAVIRREKVFIIGSERDLETIDRDGSRETPLHE